MSIIQPANPLNNSFSGAFDFPRGVLVDSAGNSVNVCAPGEVPNVSPGTGTTTWMETWYSQSGFGIPVLPQGWPTVYESPAPAETEDPDASPWIDLLLDKDRTVVINHTGRLSGALVELFINGSYQYNISIGLHPLMGTTVPTITYPQSGWQTIAANSSWVCNYWYLLNPKTLAYTLRAEIPSASLNTVTVPSIYRLVVNWDFRHKPPGENTWHNEPLGGFDHNVVFRVGDPTT
jgi:hypothetical protein